MIYLRLVPTFEKNLLKLSQHGKGKEKKRSKLGNWLLTKICSTKEENFIVNLYLPVYLFLSVIFIGIFGVRIWSDLLVVFIHSLLYALICFLLIKKSLPFSESFDDQQKDASKTFLLLILLPVLVGLHYICTLVPYGVYGYLVMMAVLVKVIWRKVLNVSWDYVQR
jgi:ABC-2 type transport system permease protein